MGSLSGAVRRVARVGVPVAAVLAAVLVSGQVASAATATPNHAVPAPPQCVVKHLPAPTGVAKATAGGGGGVVIVTKPGKPTPGQPKPGQCVACGGQVKPGAGSGVGQAAVTSMRMRCVVCVVRVKVPGPGKPGQVTTSKPGLGSGTVTISTGHGIKPPVHGCPVLPPILSRSAG